MLVWSFALVEDVTAGKEREMMVKGLESRNVELGSSLDRVVGRGADALFSAAAFSFPER